MWMKKYTKIRVILFKNGKLLLKMDFPFFFFIATLKKGKKKKKVITNKIRN